MKRWLAILITLAALASLPACQEAGDSTRQAETVPPAVSTGGDGTAEEQAGAGVDRPLYVMVGGQLVGSWADGRWVSADGPEEQAFTLAEVLAEEGYYVYNQGDWSEPRENYLMQCEFYTYNDGVSGFQERDLDTQALLDPLAAFVPEDAWEERAFALPTDLTGQAAELLVPDYGFSFRFGGTTPDLAVSRRLSLGDAYWYTWEPVGPEEYDPAAEEHALAEEILAERGYGGEYTLDVIRVATDRGEDAYFFLSSAYDEGGYWLEEPGVERFFSLVLCRRADGTVETVYEETVSYEDYLEDTPLLFHVEPVGVWDINGDGVEEVCLLDRHWEWGWHYVLERGADGSWEIVLQAEY